MIAEPAPALLEFRDVRKHYRSGSEVVRAVDGVSLRIEAGQLAVLYGPSGSGKSTLLRVAAGIESPDGGNVLVAGRDVSRLSEREGADYRLNVLGWIDQHFDLMPGATALEGAASKRILVQRNLKAARAHVKPLLEELGLGGRLNHRLGTMSQGERQRVMIALALSMDPQVVLADEPTGNLDSRRSREVLGLLQRQTRERGMATLVVTHDEHAMEFADVVCTLQDGVLHEAGPDAVPST
ncbi:MAG TPA: ABC transporter ATP-binding protein [Baekduia sp.]|nr:ABC transporter ATP-binding protein [Baekduia sp.]